MTPDERAHIKAREAAATPGPWSSPWNDDQKDAFRAEGGEAVVAAEEYDAQLYLSVLEADATFIAAARTDVPALVAEVEKLVGLLDAFDRYASSPNDTGYVGSPFEAEVLAAIDRERGES